MCFRVFALQYCSISGPLTFNSREYAFTIASTAVSVVSCYVSPFLLSWRLSGMLLAWSLHYLSIFLTDFTMSSSRVASWFLRFSFDPAGVDASSLQQPRNFTSSSACAISTEYTNTISLNSSISEGRSYLLIYNPSRISILLKSSWT
jgi:hypothetical protein